MTHYDNLLVAGVQAKRVSEERATLESLVDRHGLQAVIRELADIAYLKGEHIEANWQDTKTARPWFSNGYKLHRTADGLSPM